MVDYFYWEDEPGLDDALISPDKIPPGYQQRYDYAQKKYILVHKKGGVNQKELYSSDDEIS